MTGEEQITEFETLVDDDTTDQSQVLRWINQSYDRINIARIWNYLRKQDTSNVIVGGTVTYSLPADFLFPSKEFVYLLDSNGEVSHKLKIVSFQDNLEFVNRSGYVYFDLVNSNLVFTARSTDLGSYIGKTLYIPYQYRPDQLTTSTSPVFERAFHILPVYHAAKTFWYADQQEKERSFHREMDAEFARLMKEFRMWDQRMDFATKPSAQPLDNWSGID